MAHEIERKFLVTGNGWQNAATGSVAIRQAYLAVTELASIRVRILDGTSAALTIKSREPGMSRREFEYPLAASDAEAMMALRTGNIIAKRRHIVPFKGATWEVDAFGGELEGLVLAECELEREVTEIELPDWIGAEVTNDRRYYNDALRLGAAPG